MIRACSHGVGRRACVTKVTCAAIAGLILSTLTHPVTGGPVVEVNQRARNILGLRNAVSIALQNNFGVAVRRVEVASAEQDVELARATFEPVFAASATRNTNAQIAGIQAGDYTAYSASVGGRVPTGGTVSLSTNTSRTLDGFNFPGEAAYQSDVHLNVRQPLLRGGGVRYNMSPIALGKIGVAESDYELRKAVLDLVRNVEVAYWEVVFAHRDRAVREETVAVAQRLLEETRARGDVGLATGVEPLQAEAALVLRSEALISSRQAIDDRTDRLLLLMGQLGAAQFDVALPRTLPTVDEPRLDERETSRLIERLPDYRQFDAILQRRKVLIGRARNEALPTVDVNLGGGYTGFGTGYGDAYNQAFSSDARDWQAVLEMRVPLGFRSERANLAKRKFELQIDELRRREFEQALRLQIREAARAVVAANERVRVTSTSLRLTTEQYDQLRAKFGEGLAPFREMLLVQDDLQEAGLRAVRANFDAVQARIRLARFDGSLLKRYGLEWADLEIGGY